MKDYIKKDEELFKILCDIGWQTEGYKFTQKQVEQGFENQSTLDYRHNELNKSIDLLLDYVCDNYKVL